jgi:WD40 repeat protein
LSLLCYDHCYSVLLRDRDLRCWYLVLMISQCFYGILVKVKSLLHGWQVWRLCLHTVSACCQWLERVGHQQLINEVLFSPDGRIIASASFDKSIKLWHGKTGQFIAALRGHVQAVYQVKIWRKLVEKWSKL